MRSRDTVDKSNMTPTASFSQEYLKNTVLTATAEQLQLMLYDGAIRFATRGREALAAGDRAAAFEALDRAQRIVLELGEGLRPEVNPALAGQMASLYSFIYRRLVEANVQQDVQALDEALRILRHQRETWVLLMERLRGTADSAAHAAGPPARAETRAKPLTAARAGAPRDAPTPTIDAAG